MRLVSRTSIFESAAFLRIGLRWVQIATAAALLGQPVFAERINVFAAASLQGALDEVAALWSEASGNEAVITYAGSSVLARQILQGAPADVFFSANQAWMQTLVDEGHADAADVADLVGNRLVLVSADTGAGEPTVIGSNYDLSAKLGNGRVSMALVNAVPAGIYGRQALESLGLWEAIRDKVAQTDNVRAALALVALNETPLGLVYQTDANAEPRVRVAGVFPDTAHAPIVYPVAPLRDAAPTAEKFVAYLRSPRSRETFKRYGFTILAGQ